MYVLTNSIFHSFLECQARTIAMYGWRIKGDKTIPVEWEDPGNKAMACGSLVDAIVTRGFIADETDAKIKPEQFYLCLKSSYDDGMKSAKWLTNKSGGWNAEAQKAILAAKRLLADPFAKSLAMRPTIYQARLSFEVAPGIMWEGDIDILTVIDEHLHIIDLKSPSRIEDGWITMLGRNVKAPWSDAWGYWFQLSGYRYGIEYGADSTINGTSIDTLTGLANIIGDASWVQNPIKTGLLYTTREDWPRVGYEPVKDQASVWQMIMTSPVGGGPSNLDVIRAVLDGQIKPTACGKCDYCNSRSMVHITDADEERIPMIDDIYGFRCSG